jgi:beta-lactamase superfamily II metal-dependent hydrolase
MFQNETGGRIDTRISPADATKIKNKNWTVPGLVFEVLSPWSQWSAIRDDTINGVRANSLQKESILTPF